MAQQIAVSAENNFIKGLVTEATALNFPENAATDSDNCEYTYIGEVVRRNGVDYEENYALAAIDRTNRAVSTYKWNNVGGDGSTQFLVSQIGSVLYFYNITNTIASTSISQNKLAATLDMNSFVPVGNSFDITKENTYADGNGYLFVFNENCDPIYCSYSGGSVTGQKISVKIRDFIGVPETTEVNFRPLSLTTIHNYNLQNQGWTSGQPWTANSTDSQTDGPLGARVWTVQTGLTGITPGQIVTVKGTITGDYRGLYCLLAGTVTSYTSGTGALVMNITSDFASTPTNYDNWTFTPTNTGYITTWQTAEGNYPSNADVWWYFKNSSGVFDPTSTQPNVSISVGNAPQGHYLLDAFNQDRSSVSGLSLTSITTTKRPTIGTWFQGRVWYSGVNANQIATGTAPFYSWSENIYFSQVNIGTSVNFGNCFQVNDPTSENLFDILPTDGGVIQIQGSGPVYKLFPTQNGLLVFAANGVWFITGSQGIGFTANDYTITKLSSVESISTTSFVDVMGLPYFWNEEGVYSVQPQQGGGLSIESITNFTIQTFFDNIPRQNKRYVRGAYNPLEFVIQWIFKSTEESDITSRYSFDKILNYSTYTKAFYPYTIDTTASSINSIAYVQGPGNLNSFRPKFKFLVSAPTATGYNVSIGDMHDEDYVDWASSGNPVDFTSYFITGYRLRGKGTQKSQLQYLQVFSKQDGAASAYKIQGMWDYANSGDSGRWTTVQRIENNLTNFSTAIRRHKIRGSGLALQFKIQSVQGAPFNIQGWAAIDTVNAGM